MGFLLTCLSIVLAYFSPTELVPSLAPFHIQLAIMLMGLAASILTLASRPASGLQSPQYLLILGLWVVIAGSHIVRLRFRWAADAIFTFGPLVVIYFLVHMNTFSVRRVKIIGGLVITCGVIMASQAILAYYTGFLGATLLLTPPTEPLAQVANRVRGYGFLQDPNDFAQFLLVSICLLGLFWKKTRTVRNLVLLGPAAIVMAWATYLTFSRGGLLGLGAVLFASIYRKGRRIPAVAISVLGLAVLYAFNFTGGRHIGIDASSAGRLISWGAGVASTLHHPLFGVGFGRYTDINDLTAHNSFVLCFTELGLVGYFFWLALLIVSFAGLTTLTRLAPQKPEDAEFSGMVHACRAALLAFLVTGWFLSRTYTETLYILLALIASVIQLRGKAIPAGLQNIMRLIPRTLMWEFASIAAVYVAVRARLM